MDKNVSRRQFLAGAAGAVVISAGAISIAGCASGSQNAETAKPATMELNLDEEAYAPLRTAGGAVKVEVSGMSKPVIVIRKSAAQAVAFSSRCTHAGCEVDLPSGGSIVCQCHGSQFDTNGSVTKGPAASALQQFSAVVQENTIILKM